MPQTQPALLQPQQTCLPACWPRFLMLYAAYDACLRKLRVCAAMHGCTHTVLVSTFVSEAWTLKEASLPLRVPVSEHPNRVEGVFVQMASRHGDLILTTHFKRDKEHHPIRPRSVSSAWRPGSPSSNFGGIFANAS